VIINVLFSKADKYIEKYNDHYKEFDNSQRTDNEWKILIYQKQRRRKHPSPPPPPSPPPTATPSLFHRILFFFAQWFNNHNQNELLLWSSSLVLFGLAIYLCMYHPIKDYMLFEIYALDPK
ncbi:unnamed protein product, partial [Rotaria socialis]